MSAVRCAELSMNERSTALADDVRRSAPDIVIARPEAAASLSAALAGIGATPVVTLEALRNSDGATRALLVDADAEMLAAVAALGLFRTDRAPSASNAILVQRRDIRDGVCWYEQLLDRLSREVAVYHRLSREYQAETVAREHEIDRLDPNPIGPEAQLPPATPIFELIEDLVILRARFAPPASARTRFIDVATRWTHRATTTFLKILDYRDAAIARARRAGRR